ncbi:MAG: hypothetical protein ACK5XN_26725, partial [Bacteroidota bacterium]
PGDGVYHPPPQRRLNIGAAGVSLPVCVTHLGFEKVPFQLGAAFFCVDFQAVTKNMHKFENNCCAVLLRGCMFAAWKSQKSNSVHLKRPAILQPLTTKGANLRCCVLFRSALALPL